MILAIETSTPQASLALLDPCPAQWRFETAFHSDRAHNSAIFGPLQKTLDALDHSGSSLTGIAIGTGPGSYGGVRVGIAVGTALAMTHHLPLIGWPSFATLGRDIWVAGDARRGAYYLARIEAHRLIGEPSILERDAFLAEIAKLETRQEPIVTMDAAIPLNHPWIQPAQPTAATLARIAAEQPPSAWRPPTTHPIEPIYLRPPHITQAKKSH